MSASYEPFLAVGAAVAGAMVAVTLVNGPLWLLVPGGLGALLPMGLGRWRDRSSG